MIELLWTLIPSVSNVLLIIVIVMVTVVMRRLNTMIRRQELAAWVGRGNVYILYVDQDNLKCFRQGEDARAYSSFEQALYHNPNPLQIVLNDRLHSVALTEQGWYSIKRPQPNVR